MSEPLIAEIRTEQHMVNERQPDGPKRYFLGDEEISEERYWQLVEQRARSIDAGHCGLVD